METRTAFHKVVEIARRLEHICRYEKENREAKKPDGFGVISGSYSRNNVRHGRGHFSRPL